MQTITMKSKKKILILGATGFIGLNLTLYFSKNNNYEVHAVRFRSNKINIKGVRWHKADLRNYNKTEKLLNNIDVVIQAAATTSGSKDIINNPYLHVTDNAVMNSYILKAVFKNKVEHFIFLSCSVMYKSSKKPIKENEYKINSKIDSNYFGVGNTKVYIENMCKFYSKICETKFTTIRHSNIYGPFDKFDFEKSHFFGATISKVMLSEKNIVVWGQGEESRDLLYIDDLINFIQSVITHQKSNFRIYNCGLSKAYSIDKIVKKIIKISKKKLKIHYDSSKPNIKTSIFLDTSLAYKEIRWKPMTSLDNGIIKTIKWWRKNINNKNLKLKK